MRATSLTLVPRWTAAVLDVACVLGFVLLGRSSHAEALSLAGLAATSAPFLIGLAVVWAAVVLMGRDPRTLTSGVAVWAGTWGLGMILRGTVFGAGTAAAFVVVAAVSLGLSLLGWRLIATAVRRRRATVPAARG